MDKSLQKLVNRAQHKKLAEDLNKDIIKYKLMVKQWEQQKREEIIITNDPT